MSEIKNGDPVATFIIQVAALSWAAVHDRESSTRYKGSAVPEFQEFCSETCFSPLLSVKHGILCGTRPWSVSGGRGELSHYALDDRHEGGAKPGARGQSALAELCRLYWYPLYMFARRRGHSPDDAQELTQGFFYTCWKQRALAGVDRLKGKFRSFLLASFQNHLSDQVDRARRLKRGGGQEFVELDAEEAEERYRLEPTECFNGRKNVRCSLGNDAAG